MVHQLNHAVSLARGKTAYQVSTASRAERIGFAAAHQVDSNTSHSQTCIRPMSAVRSPGRPLPPLMLYGLSAPGTKSQTSMILGGMGGR